MKNFRLSSELDVFLIKEKSIVFFSPVNESRFKTNLLKYIRKTYRFDNLIQNIRIINEKFKLKFNHDLKLEVSSPHLPNPGTYYIIGNLVEEPEYTYKILSQLTCINGEFSSYLFEISSDYINNAASFEVFPVCQEMKEYNEYLQNFSRYISFDIKRKTRTLIPGHAYSTKDKTLYYLGEVKLRKSPKTGFIDNNDDCDLNTGYLYTEVLKENCKSISDILKSYSFGDELKISNKKITAVDCGEVLKDEDFKFQDYWEDLIKNTINNNRRNIDEENIPNLSGINSDRIYNNEAIFDILSVQSPGAGKIQLSKSIISLIESVLRENLKFTFSDSVLMNNIYNRFSPKNSREKLESKIISLQNSYFYSDFFYRYNYSTSIMEKSYRLNLFKYYNIDFLKICEDIITNWSDKDIYSNFDNYLKNINYTLHNYADFSFRNIEYSDVNSTFNKYPDLLKSINYLINMSTNNFGLGVCFYISNKKNHTANIRITLYDLLKNIKINNLSLTNGLINDIMKFKFHTVCINNIII